MNHRDAQVKAYCEYQEALQAAEKKKPEGSWYKVPDDDGSEEARLMYDPAGDILELALIGNSVKISGKYLRSFQAALNAFMSE
jgi:hypothetical protein